MAIEKQTNQLCPNPQCKKQMSCCSVCLNPVDLLNPAYEMSMRQQAPGGQKPFNNFGIL